jgi:hypothetical protein
MKKLTLSLESLTVESFSPGSHALVKGTVKARELDSMACSHDCSDYTQADTCAVSFCTCVQSPCDMASRERTFVCCQGTANCPPG